MVLLFSAGAVLAHPEIDDQIEHYSKLLADAGKEAGADLFFQRGELYRVHGEWNLAFSDFERALEIDSSLAAVRFCRGRLWLDKGEPHRAVEELTAFLKFTPGDRRGLALRARAHSEQGEYEKADADYDAAVSGSELPSPELVLEWAECRLACGGVGEGTGPALAALDRGIERLGPLVTLQSRAVDLECERGEYAAALARISQIMATNGTSPVWLKREAEILVKAGHPDSATRVYGEALVEIDRLPEHRRSVRAFRSMRIEIESDLARINSPNNGRN